MVLDGPGKEKLEQKLLALRNCLLVFAGTESGGWLNMGVSRSFEDLSHFRGAYFESLEALKITSTATGMRIQRESPLRKAL